MLSCDPAGKAGPRNDYSAITVIGLQQQAIHLLEVSRGRWLLMQMRDQIMALAARWGVDTHVIEDTASGMSLIPMLKEQTRLNVVGRNSNVDKITRMSRQQGRFEAGRILLPNEAPWLADFENELLAFPYGRYDDQVDALLLFLDWLAENERYLQPVIACPVVIVRQTDPFPWEPTPRWTDW